MSNYYELLGVSRTATQDEIKKAYRRLAKLYHPDATKGDKAKESKFKGISEAYNTLSDPGKRKEYDMMSQYGGFAGAQGFGGGFPGGGQGDVRWESAGPGGFEDLGDIFGEIFGMGGVRRPGFGGDGGHYSEPMRRRQGPQKGADTFTHVEIGFLEAIHGASRTISIKRGSQVETLKVKIPAGVGAGSKVRVAGRGHPGEGNGKSGDLYLHIQVSPHDLFWREDTDIFQELPITIYEAVLGATIDVTTLDGTAKMKIPAGTESGQKFRLKGKGVPSVGKHKAGDMYVIVKIVPPKKIDKDLEALCRECMENHPYNPRKGLPL